MSNIAEGNFKEDNEAALWLFMTQFSSVEEA